MRLTIGVVLTILITAMFVTMVKIGNAEFVVNETQKFSSATIAVLVLVTMFPIIWIGVLIQRHYWYRG